MRRPPPAFPLPRRNAASDVAEWCANVARQCLGQCTHRSNGHCNFTVDIMRLMADLQISHDYSSQHEDGYIHLGTRMCVKAICVGVGAALVVEMRDRGKTSPRVCGCPIVAMSVCVRVHALRWLASAPGLLPMGSAACQCSRFDGCVHAAFRLWDVDATWALIKSSSSSPVCACE